MDAGVRITYLKASNPSLGQGLPYAGYMAFGSRIAISSGVPTLAVGSLTEAAGNGVDGDQRWGLGRGNCGDDNGAVYVFGEHGSTWVQDHYVLPLTGSSGAGFGEVAISADGSTLVVGAPTDPSMAAGVGGDPLDYDLSRCMGASGAAWVFRRTPTSWEQEAYLKPPDPEIAKSFGASLAISADGSTLAVGEFSDPSGAVGIDGNPRDTSAQGSGAVFVFTRTGSTWSQQAYIKASNTRQETDLNAGDWFGAALALSADGSTLAVGAMRERSGGRGVDADQTDQSAIGAGAVYVFRREGARWAQTTYIKATNADAGDGFGTAVALSADGATLVVGAPSESSGARLVDGDQSDNGATGAGAVYVFTDTAGTWSQQAYVKASNTDSGDGFGWAVALSSDGTRLLVGAPNEGSCSRAIDGDQSDDTCRGAGAVYEYHFDGAAWSYFRYIKASNTARQVAYDAGAGSNPMPAAFGWSVATDGVRLVVGAPFEDSAACCIDGDQNDHRYPNAGAVYVYEFEP
jgi:hypothetical protein